MCLAGWLHASASLLRSRIAETHGGDECLGALARGHEGAPQTSARLCDACPAGAVAMVLPRGFISGVFLYTSGFSLLFVGSAPTLSMQPGKVDVLLVSVRRPCGEALTCKELPRKSACSDAAFIWTWAVCMWFTLFRVLYIYAAIWQALLGKTELRNTSAGRQSRQATGGALGGHTFTGRKAAHDCTASAVSAVRAVACLHDALQTPAFPLLPASSDEYFALSWHVFGPQSGWLHKTPAEASPVKGPLLELGGACSPSGELPCVQLLRQKFGDSMAVVSRSGCFLAPEGSQGLSPWKASVVGEALHRARLRLEDAAEHGLAMPTSTVRCLQRGLRIVTVLCGDAADRSGLP
mmetsp:Transcript_98885/g.308134  ORF Transcript_98885/g.308134 Transcript_98885/m.308134 type:complete len:351 (-) Transcript_98885:291-1343(-)